MPNAPTRREISDLVARYVSMLARSYRSRAWMNCRSHLARLVQDVHQLDYEHLRDAARALAGRTDLSKSYRRDVISTWRRFLAWCSEELVIDAALVDRFTHVRLRFPSSLIVRSAEPGCLSSPPAEGPGSEPIVAEPPSMVVPRLGRRPGALVRTAPDPRRDPDAFFEIFLEALPFFAPDLRDVVRLLAFTGARPLEVLRLTTFAIDTTCTPWVATIDEHKSIESTGAPKLIVLNQGAMSILDRRIKPFTPHDWLFPAPKDVNRHIQRDLVQKRLRRTILRQKLPTWTLYDLRRWAATTVRGSGGLDSAQALLGHSRASTTEIYAPPNHRRAIEAAQILDRWCQR